MTVFVRIRRTHQGPAFSLSVSSDLKKSEFLPLPLPPSFSFLLLSTLSLIFKNHICVCMCPHKWRLGEKLWELSVFPWCVSMKFRSYGQQVPLPFESSAPECFLFFEAGSYWAAFLSQPLSRAAQAAWFSSFSIQMRELEWRSWVVCPHHTENRQWQVLGSGMVAPSPGPAQGALRNSLSV